MHMKVMVVAAAVSLLSIQVGCATTPVPPVPAEKLTAPQPIQGNSGEYMCPYTSADTVAKWCGAAKQAALGAAVGKAGGAYAGQKAGQKGGQKDLVGGFLGAEAGADAGEAAGREIAIKAAGGQEAIKATSDLSFNNHKDLILWLYVKHSKRDPEYQQVLKATGEIYPDVKKDYDDTIIEASEAYRQTNPDG